MPALACACLPLAGCLQESGTEIPNELVGKEFIAGRGPAANAELKLIPVGYIPGGTQGPDSAQAAVVTAKTDDKGRFAFKDVSPGQYNLIAAQDGLRSFRDSLVVTGKAQDLSGDTLDAPGTLSGWVELEPQDDPQTATVQVMGTTRFVNVDARGFFRLKDLGAGEYRLRVVTILPLYAPLFQEVVVRAGADDTLAQPLLPFFAGIPVIRGLTAMPDVKGIVHLAWSKPKYGKVLDYLVYRDTAGTLLPSALPILRIKDTCYEDTIYSRTPRAGQYGYDDSAYRTFSYRVKILDWSGNVGPSYGFTEATVAPPTVLDRAFPSADSPPSGAATADAAPTPRPRPAGPGPAPR
jgi:hypothetical protein